jgi:hypothetical protein
MKAADGKHPVLPMLLVWPQDTVKPLALEPADVALVSQGSVPAAVAGGGHSDGGF